MNTSEKLRAILKNLEEKELSPDAFHLGELRPVTYTHDIDEFEVWEYKIGEDILKIEWGLEDITIDTISIYLNGKSAMKSSKNAENERQPKSEVQYVHARKQR